MARMEQVMAVAAAEDARPAWCDSCMSSDGFEARVFAMVPSGLQQIATFTGCDRCGDEAGTITCFYCGQTATGGAEFFDHVRDKHAELAGG